MRVLIPAVLAVATACGRPDPDTVVPFDADAHIAAWVEMWNTYDLDRVADLFLDDARVTYFSSESEGVIAGPAAISAHHEGFGYVAGGREPERELWVEDVRSDVFGTAAVVTAVWHFGNRASPRDSVQRGPMTAVYTRSGDGYRIAHMHFANY